jgi:hypothetical protein
MRRPSLVGPVAPQRPPRSRTSPPRRRSARSAFVASAESPWLVTAMVCLRCPPPDAGPPDRQALPGAKPVRVTKYISEANRQVPTVSSITPAGALQTKEDQRVPASFDDDATVTWLLHTIVFSCCLVGLVQRTTQRRLHRFLQIAQLGKGLLNRSNHVRARKSRPQNRSK